MRIAQLTRDVEAFPDERIRRSIISLLDSKHASGKKRARAQLRRSCSPSQLQQPAQPVPALAKVLATLPEAKQGCSQTQRPLRISGFGQPLERGPKIVMFEREAFQPFRSFRAALLRS